MAYSEERIAEALVILQVSASMGEAQRVLKDRWGKAPDKRTLKRWRGIDGETQPAHAKEAERHLAIQQKTQDTKEEIAFLFESYIRQAIKEGVTKDKIAATGLKDLFTSLGIAADKMQLLRGEPTGINEQRGGLNVFTQVNVQQNNE